VTLHAFALYAAFRVSYRNTVLTGSSSVLARIVEGLRLTRGDRRLIGTLVVTMIYNLFGWPFTSMVSVIGQNQLGLGAEGIGILVSMDGVGALCGALLLALCLRPVWYARAYLGGVLARQEEHQDRSPRLCSPGRIESVGANGSFTIYRTGDAGDR
jgi:hypothetical protein